MFNRAALTLLSCLFAVTGLAYLTFFHSYAHPDKIFGDERISVPAAERYLHRVHAINTHPPLGRLLAALGEYIIDANPDRPGIAARFQVSEGDIQSLAGDTFSFRGYRLFPALLGWLTAPLLFFIFFIVSGSALSAALLSTLYIFNNAFIVHFRGALIDSTLIFFLTLELLIFVVLLKRSYTPRRTALLVLSLGAAFGAVAATKLTGLVLALLFPAVLLVLRKQGRGMVASAAAYAAGFLLIYCAIWSTHFRLGTRIEPLLEQNGFFSTDEEYQKILLEGRQGTLAAFPVMWRVQALDYPRQFHMNEAPLNLCKPMTMGSPPIFWPLGARAIMYRAEPVEPGAARYVYLVSNPVIWAAGLAGVVGAVGLLFGWIFLPLKKSLSRPFLTAVFAALYFGYMIAAAMLPRAMYLYHYFPPLIFSLVLFALLLNEIVEICGRAVSETQKIGFLSVLAAGTYASFLFFSPLTYYHKVRDEELQKRALLSMWDLTCYHCPLTNSIARP